MISTRAYRMFIYINDLEEAVTSNILKRADDNKLLIKQIKGNGYKLGNCRMTLVN